MKTQFRLLCLLLLLPIHQLIFGQAVSFYKQFNGRFDFTFVGNTLNRSENNITDECAILTRSSATLNLSSTDFVEKAYLYWSGSGTGDFEVTLNGTPVVSERNFGVNIGLDYFGAFADVTTIVKSTGNGVYTLSDLDLTDVIQNQTGYCGNRTNYGGWAIIVVYKNAALPLNQLTIYDGFQTIPDSVTINLNSLNVIDNADAKIAFLAWEGDSILAVNETLSINGNLLSNSLNPSNNQFNGTNTFTGSNTLYNMDLDEFNIQNNIAIGDTTAQIKMTSGQDRVFINTIVTKLNSQLPDATINITNIDQSCDSNKIKVSYKVSNLNSTNPLPAGVKIALYADTVLIGTAITPNTIPIDGSWSGIINGIITSGLPDDFTLTIVVDDDGTGHGAVAELIETNNKDSILFSVWKTPILPALPPLNGCDKGFSSSEFNFSDYVALVKTNPSDTVAFFETQATAIANNNPIANISSYLSSETPKSIYVRVDNLHCYATTSFELVSRKCPPVVFNAVSANNDGKNDTFIIEGLRDIFLNYELFIYNRWGRLVWSGNNNQPNFNGYANQGDALNSERLPEGTYYYVLELHDPEFEKPMVGYLYLTY